MLIRSRSLWFYLRQFELLRNICALRVVCHTQSALSTFIDSRCLLPLLLLGSMFFHFARYQTLAIKHCVIAGASFSPHHFFFFFLHQCLHYAPCTRTKFCLDRFKLMSACERACRRDLSVTLTSEAQRSVVTAHLQPRLAPLSEIKSLFSRAY